MPNLELYFMRYYNLKNYDSFTKLVSKSGIYFESDSIREESVSHLLTGRRSWKQIGTVMGPRRRGESVEVRTLLVRCPKMHWPPLVHRA